MSYDAVIVGSGINGLAAGVHLSRRGWKIAVLERNDVIGGAVRTAEVTLPGFRHDLFAMNLSMFAGSPFFAEHQDVLVPRGLELVAVDRPFASAFPSGTSPAWIGVEQGLERTVANIERASQRDAVAWREMSERFDREAPFLFELMGSPMPSWKAARTAWRMFRALGVKGMLEAGQLLLSSPRNWLAKKFESDTVQAMLAMWGLHLDFAPDVAGGALFPYLESMAGQRFGMALGKGGADTTVNAMARYIVDAGGAVIPNSSVRRIEVGQGRAKGVELDSGERLEARKAVIANVHPRLLYGRLLAGESESNSPAAKLRSGPATMMIHLALDELPKWRGGSELQRFAYVHLAPSLDQMARTYSDAMNGVLPRTPALVVGQPTAFDSTRAPAGKHVLWVQVRVLPRHPRGDANGEIESTDWDEIKDRYADRVMEIIDSYAPGLNKSVLGRHVLSPLDLERGNPNLQDGDSLSGSHHLDQFFLFRPAIGRSRWTTGVENLFHVGASTWPGAGTGAASGYMLAKLIGA